MKIAELLDRVKTEGRGFLLEDEAKEVLALCGVPVTPCAVAASEEEAVRHAATLGYPVVLKIRSSKIIHKTELGGVRLNLLGEAEVRLAFQELKAKASYVDEKAKVLVQPMAVGGVEVIVGFTRDRQFGPVVAFGLGGVFVEVLEDVAFRLAPLDEPEASRMIAQVKGAKLLEGYRGAQPADLEALKDIIVKVSRLGAEYQQIIEMDLNPVVAYQKGALVLDARIRIS